MAVADWTQLLQDGDFAGARAAWQDKFAGGENGLDATWELAEIEELWGDSCFFSGEAGGAPHYQAARAALVPPGQQFSSLEESERRMEAHRRVSDKLYAIDPYGRARPSHDGQPHPNYRPAPPRPPAPEPAPSVEERRASVLHQREARVKGQSEIATLFQDRGNYGWYALASQWREAGQALMAAYPAGAREAFEWSIYYFERYNRDWTAHLPASRWDSDGGQEMAEVQEMTDSLAGTPPATPLPEWIDCLLAGDWQGALATLGSDRPAPGFRAVATVLAEACNAAGRHEDAARLLAE